MKDTKNRVPLRALIPAVACLALIFTGSARRAAGDDWQPITAAELALKDNPASPGDDAMILYRESTINAKDLVQHGDYEEEYVRIKIFTQAGVKYGDVEIPYMEGQGNQYVPPGEAKNDLDIVGVRGRTIHPDGSITPFSGKVLQKVVDRAGGYKYLEATFTMPDVHPGCIIEYRYRKDGQPRWIHDESWTVSQDIYTREAHFTFVPFAGYSGYVPYYRLYNIPSQNIPKCGIGVDKACEMALHDIPAVVEEPLMPPADAIRERVEWYYQETGQPFNEATDHFWNRTAKKWDGDLDHFVDKKKALEAEAGRVTNGSDSPDTKLEKLYARTQQIRRVDEDGPKTDRELKSEGLKPNENAEDVLSHGYGTGRDVNYLFVGLARAAGFDATDVRVTPRDTEFFNPIMENTDELAADVVWVRAGAKEYYLDPAARTYPFGLLPWPESGAGGIRPGKQGAQIVTVPGSGAANATTIRKGDLQIGADGTLSGTLDITFAGQEAALRRLQQAQADETGRTKALHDEIADWLPAGATFELTKISNWADAEKPLEIEGTVKAPSFASSAARRMLVPETLFQPVQASALKAETRVNPVYFDYAHELTDDLKFEAPAGYKIESVPQAQKSDLQAVSYEISCTQQGSGLEVKRQLVVNGVLFPKDTYGALRVFFSLVRTWDRQQAVLENAQSTGAN